MQAHLRNQLSAIRRRRGIAVSDLARRVGVTRQTIYAIEAGDYVPNTEVSLRLARELEVSVEELFALSEERPNAAEPLSAEVLSATSAAKGQPVRICRVGPRWIGVPASASPYYLPEADGVVSRVGREQGRAGLVIFAENEPFEKRLVLAGCDPAAGLLAHMVEKASGVEIVPAPASSRLALTWLKEGKVHVAGSHLEDPETGEFNLPFLRREFAEHDLTVVTFARWEEGFVLAKGNPKGIRSTADLARKNIQLVNRERGSGARALLDRLLGEAGVPPNIVGGYDHVVYGHLAAAYAVFAGDADCCLATRSAARTFGLDFLPLKAERYDLVMRRQTLELPAAQAFLDVLQRASLRRKLELLAGYDTAETGAVRV